MHLSAQTKTGNLCFRCVFIYNYIVLFFPIITGTVISQIFIIVAKNNSKCPVWLLSGQTKYPADFLWLKSVNLSIFSKKKVKKLRQLCLQLKMSTNLAKPGTYRHEVVTSPESIRWAYRPGTFCKYQQVCVIVGKTLHFLSETKCPTLE